MITVLTTGRSASTWYCDKLAKETGYENLDEIFIRQSNTTLFLKNKEINQGSYFFPKFVNNSNYIVKLIAAQRHKQNIRLFDQVLNSSSKIVFLLRKDCQAQIKSLLSLAFAITYHKKYAHDEFNVPIIIPKEYIDENWKKWETQLITQLTYLYEVYSTSNFNKELVFTEDAVQHDYRKLNRPFVYETNLPYSEHINKLVEKFK